MSQTSPVGRPLRPRGKLLQEDARRHHRSLLLQQLFREGPASRADLARTTGLTRVTVSDLVGELVADGLVRELGAPAESRVGKPPTLVGLDADSTHVIGLDLSATDRMTGAVVNLAGIVQARHELPLDGATGAAAVALVHRLATELIAMTDRPVLGVGVGSPGVVDAAGTVIDAPNLSWTDTPLAASLADALGLPVFVANDANTAVLGEHTFGASGDGGLMVLRVGIGVGAGLVLEGSLLHGHLGAAGEIGHVVVDPDGERCACGRTGCLETILAVPHLRRRLAGRAAAEVLTTVGKQLGAALAPVVGTLNLHELVLSGPQELLDGPLREAADRTIRERTMPVSSAGLVVRTSTLGEDVVLVGAAVLVLSGQLGVS
ncbi:ROK family transcriptional regulator [Nocardioides sp. YIM 152315]|uniref:ROK family transcriptional regulator n=1 Tax=Nocardioides sp. YIM 152315 TaxID=3031760 RepID=UPI0023DBB3D5|nr:ROK family transcriptional regulator [Nocardioides sp. YIM 152315]MDF1604254.1 ROK family transcriptional regulator [Nocardioides sp. YIM 152315]